MLCGAAAGSGATGAEGILPPSGGIGGKPAGVPVGAGGIGGNVLKSGIGGNAGADEAGAAASL